MVVRTVEKERRRARAELKFVKRARTITHAEKRCSLNGYISPRQGDSHEELAFNHLDSSAECSFC